MSAPAKPQKGASSRPSVLSIARLQSGRYRVALDRSDDESRMKPLQISSDVAVPAEVLEHFAEALHQLISEANLSGDPPDGRALSEAGKGLLDTILPRGNPGALSIRGELSQLRPGLPLLIATDDPGVPWELLKEEGGDDYIGLKFDIGRRLVSALGAPVGRRENSQRATALIVANSCGNLPETEVEARSVLHFLESRGVSCTYLEGASATFPRFLDEIRRSYQLIHFAGHVGFDDVSREYAFLLHDGKMFGASAVRSHLRGRPVVFLNGCESGLIVKGLTEAFLAGGARAVIGAMCRIPDGGAQAFAQAFYGAAFSGRYETGGALRSARLAVKGKPGLGAAWASFVLYGDPTLRVSLWDDGATSSPDGAMQAGKVLNSGGDQPQVMMVGPLRAEECCSQAWHQLEQAVLFAVRPSGTVVTTVDIFRGMIADPGSPASLSMQRLGLSARQLALPKEPLDAAIGGEHVRSTENASKILLMAQAEAIAAGRLVSMDDLLHAFVTHGGGQMGASMRRHGVVPDCLTSQIFRDGGVLDTSRFNEAGVKVLEIAEEFASQTHADILHRAHVLYALLRVPESALGSAIRDQGQDPELLGELWFSQLPRGSASTAICRPTLVTSLSADLLEMLCTAEQFACEEAGSTLIDAVHLARAWAASGGGIGGVFLVRNGVRISQLFA